MPTNSSIFTDTSGSVFFLPEGAGYITGTDTVAGTFAHYRYTLTGSIAHFGIAGRNANSGSVYYPANNTGSYFTIGSTHSGSIGGDVPTTIPAGHSTSFYVYFNTGSAEDMLLRTEGQIN